MMNSNVQAAMPKFAGLSHVCIFVDDMMEAVDYYQKTVGRCTGSLPVPLEKRRFL